MAGGFENNAYGQNYATGGGFTNSQSSPSSANAKGGSSTQSIRAVTVRQILNAEQAHAESDILVDGLEVGHVTFVGMIRNLAQNATNISYNIEDGTGMVDVRTWTDSSSASLMPDSEFQTDHYVRVIGNIKTFQNKRTVNAGHIRAITDFNEVFFHKLDAIHTHLQLTRGSGGAGAGAGGGAGAGAEEGSRALGDSLSQLEKPIQRTVMQVVFDLRGSDDNHGVPISAIARRVTNHTEKEVRNTVDELIGDGYLFSAEDDEHVLATL